MELDYVPDGLPGRVLFWGQWRLTTQAKFYILGPPGTLYSCDVNARRRFYSRENGYYTWLLHGYSHPGWMFRWTHSTPEAEALTFHHIGRSSEETIVIGGRTYSVIDPMPEIFANGIVASSQSNPPEQHLAYEIEFEMEARALNPLDRFHPGDDDRGPYQCLADGKVNQSTGNAIYQSTNTVMTRNHPLSSKIHVNTQVVEENRPMGNATFPYDIHVTRQDIYGSNGQPTENWVLVDGDGTRALFGPTTGAPTPEPGVFSRLRQTQDGFVLEGAGPPEHIEQAGNFTYNFDTAGRLLSLTDPDGNRQVVSYDGNGLPTRVLDVSSGKEITYSSAGGRITEIVENGSGARIAITYKDGKIGLVTLRGPTGAVERDYEFFYNNEGLLSRIAQYTGVPVEINFTYTYRESYEPGKRIPMANMSGGGGETLINWETFPEPGFTHRVARKTASDGNIFYDFDAQRNLRRVVYPQFAGADSPTVYTFGYDENRNVTSASNGATTWTMEYAPNGLLTRLSDGAGGTWAYTYQGVDLVSVSDALGSLYTQEYTNVLLPHRPTRWTDAEGAVSQFAYNDFGQLSLLTPPAGSPLGATSLLYEETPLSASFGWIRQIADGGGDVTRFDSHNALGDITSLTTFVEPGVSATSLVTYDALHRETERQHPDGKRFQTAYGGVLRRLETDENGQQTDYRFCVCGKPLSITRASGAWQLSWLLNRDFQVSRFQDARRFRTFYSYGLAGELTQVTYPDNSTLQYAYDNAGRLRQEVNGRGQVKAISYDGAGRVAEFAYPTTGLPGIAYAYYPDGTVREMRDGVGTTRYTYWPTRRVKSVEYDYRASGLPALQRLDYAYYPDGSLSTLTWTNGVSVVGSWTYGYDGAGKVTSVANSFGETTVYTYNGDGKLRRQENANGTATGYVYNEARDWPTQITQSRLGNTFASYALTYDNGANTVGNLTGVAESGGGTATYSYDILYRLTGENRAGTNAYTRAFQYDASGNVERVNGAAFGAYDGANKLTTLTGGRTTHDGDGNLTSVQGAGLPLGRFFWDDRSKLLRQSQGIRTVSYGYDGVGKRVMAQVGSGAKTFYLFHGDLLLGEVANGAPSAAYTWGADGLVSERLIGHGKSLWYHYGPQGETRQLTDSTGAVADTYAYTAYGLPLATTGTDSNPFRYGGKYGYYSDAGPMGIILCGARWYSPHLMRWLSHDPIGYEGGDNLLSYVGGNPIGFVDPQGTDKLISNGPFSHSYIDIGNGESAGFGWNPIGKNVYKGPINKEEPGGKVIKENHNPFFERNLYRCIRESYREDPTYGMPTWSWPPIYTCKNWAQDMWECAEKRTDRQLRHRN